MSEKRFKSKVDVWIALLIVGVVLMDIAFIYIFALSAGGLAERSAVFLTLVGVLVLVSWLTLRTYYAVVDETLKVVCGPFRWKIPVADIHSVTPTRSLWSSPALSLDRLRIEYGDGHWIMVSPADKHGFLGAIGHDRD
jgi:hypothetical protein